MGCMACASQTRANSQSRRTVWTEIPITSAVSSMLSPPKKRSSMAWALRESSLGERIERIVERDDLAIAPRERQSILPQRKSSRPALHASMLP